MISDSTLTSRLVKPALNTKFHIDYGWWGRQERELGVYLMSHLCDEHRQLYQDAQGEGAKVDWVDPETAEVQQVDAIQHTLIAHCAHVPGYITEHTSLVDGVFRVFLANGNAPLTPEELARRLNRPALTILRTLSGARVYKGLRPALRG